MNSIVHLDKLLKNSKELNRDLYEIIYLLESANKSLESIEIITNRLRKAIDLYSELVEELDTTFLTI